LPTGDSPLASAEDTASKKHEKTLILLRVSYNWRLTFLLLSYDTIKVMESWRVGNNHKTIKSFCNNPEPQLSGYPSTSHFCLESQGQSQCHFERI